MKKPGIFAFVISLFLSVNLAGQINNEYFNFEPKPDSINTEKWNLKFESLSFLQNREYFGKIADGYTLFGNAISPIVQFRPFEKVQLEAGVFLRKDFGNKKFSVIQPIFTVIIKNDSSQFRFGNLKANLNHQLIEPLYNFEGLVTNTLENGIQFQRKKHKSFLDIWIDWQRMIYHNAAFKEEIWGGTSWKPTIYNKNNFQIKAPIQFTTYHVGGQITLDNRPLTTEVNFVAGTEFIWEKANSSRKFYLQNYILGYKEQSNVIRELKSGMAFYTNITHEGKKINTMLSYYFGNSFFSKPGADIYQSINKNNFTNTEKLRSLLVLKFYKEYEIIENLYLNVRFEPYFDFRNKKFEHAEGLFIIYKQAFALKK